jgi:ABC-2 type transport system permease protein
VLYNLPLVQTTTSPTVFFIYQLNPITAAVNLFHFGFWAPTQSDASPEHIAPFVGPHVMQYAVYGLAISFVFLLIGQLVFRRLEKNFAQDL